MPMLMVFLSAGTLKASLHSSLQASLDYSALPNFPLLLSPSSTSGIYLFPHRGFNTGKLGNGGTGNTSTPGDILLPAGQTVREFGLGLFFTLFVLEDGTVYSSGSNNTPSWQFFTGTTAAPTTTPVPVVGGTDVRSVSVFDNQFCFVKFNNDIYCGRYQGSLAGINSINGTSGPIPRKLNLLGTLPKHPKVFLSNLARFGGTSRQQPRVTLLHSFHSI